MRYLLLLLTLLVPACVSTPSPERVPQEQLPLPRTRMVRETGRHELPFQPNERFIIQSVFPKPGVYENAPLIIVYFLDGKQKEWKMGGPRSSDGYLTELGWFLDSSPVDGNFMEERVIRLPTGEQITVSGNTVQRGQIRLRTVDPSDFKGFGSNSPGPF